MNTPLYHATARMHLPSILTQGLLATSYWTSEDAVADYYLGDVADTEPAVLLAVDLADLDAETLAPDWPGIEEPITGALGVSEDEIRERWSASSQTWHDSLAIVGSLTCGRTIPSHLLRVVLDEDAPSLAEYLARCQPASPVIA